MNQIISKDEKIKESSVFLGAVILKELRAQEEHLSLFELASRLSKRIGILHYRQLITTLVLLYAVDIVDFNSPNIYFKRND